LSPLKYQVQKKLLTAINYNFNFELAYYISNQLQTFILSNFSLSERLIIIHTFNETSGNIPRKENIDLKMWKIAQSLWCGKRNDLNKNIFNHILKWIPLRWQNQFVSNQLQNSWVNLFSVLINNDNLLIS